MDCSSGLAFPLIAGRAALVLMSLAVLRSSLGRRAVVGSVGGDDASDVQKFRLRLPGRGQPARSTGMNIEPQVAAGQGWERLIEPSRGIAPGESTTAAGYSVLQWVRSEP